MRLKEIKPGMVIHCKTEEEAEILCDNRGTCSGWKDFWHTYQERTCYKFNDTGNFDAYGPIEAYREITEFSDLIIPELTPAEVLKICNEICKNVSLCENCIMVGNCYAERGSDYQKVVEICEQWKAGHKKKELEVEWVDICRIIQVHDGGKKECVHEEDLSEHWKELAVEVILKDYITTHEGNYIAVVEHVCRVKQ